MPNKSAAKKYLKVSRKNHSRNQMIKKKVKEIVKKVREEIKESKDIKKIEELLREAVKIIDRAAGKKVIKKQTAARKKSRLYKGLRKLKTKEHVSSK